ncbi:50S ribosomal protein L18 [Pendulispora rubella]|uniref:Large ribosomal subunit protein uL18 n=1 Tax=Pendulispora rubella TaxID=2741070 RepID=A0ABZ2KW87_9BACT
MAMQIVGRERRKLRIRRKISGTAERPRLTVFRSAKHIYAQAVDDASGSTLAHVSTLAKSLKGADGTKTDDAKRVGQAVAKALLAKGVSKVVFDRNGYLYHGRVRALADGAREGGLEF